MKRVSGHMAGAAMLAGTAGGCGSTSDQYDKADRERPRENVTAQVISANVSGAPVSQPGPSARNGAPAPASPIPPDPNAPPAARGPFGR